MVIIKVKLVRKIKNLPKKKTSGAAGYDLISAINTVIQPRTYQGVPTGIAIEIPKTIEAQVRPRSGLAVNHGIGILNSPGTIDSDYRGEVIVILFNISQKPFKIREGDRIAQIIFTRLAKVKLKKVSHLSITKRGAGGFGHTGL